MLSWRDPEYFLEKILTEFNKNPPELTTNEMAAFMQIIFKQESSISDIFKNKKSESDQKDFHIMLGMFQKTTGNGFLDVMQMPLDIFLKMVDDLGIITGNEKYDKHRNSGKPDKKAFKEAFGNAKEIKTIIPS